MTCIRAAAILAAVLVFLLTGFGHAKGPFSASRAFMMVCSTAPETSEQMKRRMGAAEVWKGAEATGETVTLWQDGEGKWAIVVLDAEGDECIVFIGKAGELIGLPGTDM